MTLQINATLKHPLCELAKEIDDLVIEKRNVYAKTPSGRIFYENMSFYEQLFIKKHNIQINKHSSFSDVITRIKDAYCHPAKNNTRRTIQHTNRESPIKEDKTYTVTELNIRHNSTPIPLPYFQQSRSVHMPKGMFGHKKKLHITPVQSDKVQLTTNIPAFSMKLSSGTYYFDPVLLSLTIKSDGKHVYATEPPKVAQNDYEHFFVYSNGDICYGSSTRWEQYPLAFKKTPFATKHVGFTYAQVLNEAIHTLHLGYKNDSIIPVKKPNQLEHRNGFHNNVTVYDNR